MAEVLGEVDGFVFSELKEAGVRVEELSDKLIGDVRDILSVGDFSESDSFHFDFVPVEDVDTLSEKDDESD